LDFISLIGARESTRARARARVSPQLQNSPEALAGDRIKRISDSDLRRARAAINSGGSVGGGGWMGGGGVA